MGRVPQDLKVKVPDPRLSIIDRRLRRVKRIIIIASGKGGVGKSLIATTISLLLARGGRKVGLLDLDFHGPSCHIILGAADAKPEEARGLVPPEVHGIKFMSMIYFIGDRPLPLRGDEASDAFVELLTITRWDQLDYLVVDVPPGIAEEVLDIIRLIKRAEFLIITTPSALAAKTVARLSQLLQELKVPVLGLVENMCLASEGMAQPVVGPEVKLLGRLPFDTRVEKALGNPDLLLKTNFARSLEPIVKKIAEPTLGARSVGHPVRSLGPGD
ncbi:MAG: ATP-binding protein [Candidatus Hadarchaeum sp.]|uniref:Mrp/NBP35 family ATP-binding protein n=1 Tax=Candidatus Hadarchaeum sp. TaxID=2883567 RepID=UPI003D141290